MAKNNQVQGPGAEPFQTTDQKWISDPGNLGRLLKSSDFFWYAGAGKLDRKTPPDLRAEWVDWAEWAEND
eukprot:879334-Prorocentrum_minimum.AAC.1